MNLPQICISCLAISATGGFSPNRILKDCVLTSQGEVNLPGLLVLSKRPLINPVVKYFLPFTRTTVRRGYIHFQVRNSYLCNHNLRHDIWNIVAFNWVKAQSRFLCVQVLLKQALFCNVLYTCTLECEDRFMLLSEIHVSCSNKNIAMFSGWGGWGHIVHPPDTRLRTNLCGT